MEAQRLLACLSSACVCVCVPLKHFPTLYNGRKFQTIQVCGLGVCVCMRMSHSEEEKRMGGSMVKGRGGEKGGEREGERQ